MANHHAATYLNDHLAGSVVAIELLATLERTNAGTDLSQFAAKLKADITEDRQVLEALMKQLHIGVSTSRKAMAWVAEARGSLADATAENRRKHHAGEAPRPVPLDRP